MSRKIQTLIASGSRIANALRSHGKISNDLSAQKGAFLFRQFENPQGPRLDLNRRSTPLALSAAEAGEPIPKNRSAARKLARRGEALIARARRRNRAA